jgi:hypothetical protein
MSQETQNEPFFGQRFWQMMLVGSVGSIVTVVVAGVVSIYLSGQIEKLTELSESINTTISSFIKLVEVGPEGINEVGTAIQDNAAGTGAAVGDGAATVVDRVGTAWDRFREPDE